MVSQRHRAMKSSKREVSASQLKPVGSLCVLPHSTTISREGSPLDREALAFSELGNCVQDGDFTEPDKFGCRLLPSSMKTRPLGAKREFL